MSTNFYNFWQTYTWIDSQQNNAYTVDSTYCVFLHYLVEIILSFFYAVSRWNLLMSYVGKQLNSVNHTKLYWSVYGQFSICPSLSQFLNRCVLSRRRKVDSESADVTSSGKLFQVCGPTTGKARLSTVDSLVVGTARRLVPTVLCCSDRHASLDK